MFLFDSIFVRAKQEVITRSRTDTGDVPATRSEDGVGEAVKLRKRREMKTREKMKRRHCEMTDEKRSEKS